MATLSPLGGTSSLDKLAYNEIKEAILSFDFMPNQALIEGELAVQLGISKTPVRDALMQLEKEGLVSRVPFKGTYVSDLNAEDMADIFEIREVLEGLAIRLSTGNLTDDDLKTLEGLIAEQEMALRARDYVKVSKINSDFHNLIISRCSNPRLQKMLILLDDQLKRYRLLSIVQGKRSEKSIPEHRAIYTALKEKDSQKAEEALKTHLESAMKDLYNQDFTELEEILSQTNTH